MSALKNRHSQQLICSLSGTRGLNIICVNKGHIFREQSRKNCDGGLKFVNGMVGHCTCTSSVQFIMPFIRFPGLFTRIPSSPDLTLLSLTSECEEF